MVFNKDPAQRFLEPPRRGKPPGSAFRWRQARNLPQRVCLVSASPPACVPLSTPPRLSAGQRFAGWQICLVGKSMPCHGGNAFPSHMRRGKRPTLHGRRKFGDKPNGHCVNGRKAGWLCEKQTETLHRSAFPPSRSDPVPSRRLHATNRWQLFAHEDAMAGVCGRKGERG